MIRFGLDLGTSSVKLAVLREGVLVNVWEKRHYGKRSEIALEGLQSLLKKDGEVMLAVTGSNAPAVADVLNMGIPELLRQRDVRIMTLSHLPAHGLNLSQDYPGLFWPFGQHILSGVKLVARHPNLYAVCLTNHGCGPDSMLSHMLRTEMGSKPYLQLEVDEHFSRVGVITRIEAFLNTLSHRPGVELAADFDLTDVKSSPVDMQAEGPPPVSAPSGTLCGRPRHFLPGKRPPGGAHALGRRSQPDPGPCRNGGQGIPALYGAAGWIPSDGGSDGRPGSAALALGRRRRG